MLTTVGRYFDPWEAHILRGRLEAEGIPASVAGDQHIIADWPLSVALGGAALQVPTAHLAEAQKIVAAYHSGVFAQALATQHPHASDPCPTCGVEEAVGSISLGQRALAIATFLIASAPFPTRASRMHCQACGHCWRYGA